MTKRLLTKSGLVGFMIMGMLCVSAFNARAVDIKVGIVDFQKVIEGSAAYQNIRSQLDKKTDEFRASATKIEERLQKSYQELEGSKTVLSANDFTKKKTALDKEVESSQEKFHKEGLSLDKASSQAMSVLEKSFYEVVKQTAQTNNLSLVLASANVLYSDTNLDITDSVITSLNQKLPSFTVTFEDGVVADKAAVKGKSTSK